MFHELLAVWRGKDPLKGMHADLLSMIDKGREMFQAAWEEALAGRVRPDTRDRVLQTDKDVNKSERSIRRRLAEHLVIQSGTDVPACLVLMSIVKDAERVGDYCKEIMDAAAMEAEPLSRCGCFEEFKSAYTDVLSMFIHTKEALANSDKALAERVMLTERDVGRRCDALLECLLAEGGPCRVGVPRALIVQYLRRMAAHLSNMASSLVMPLHKLDYHDEKWLAGDGEDGRQRP